MHLHLISMKRSEDNSEMVSKCLYWWTLASVLLPNVLLSFTEDMSMSGRIANVFIVGGLWWWLLSISRHVGRTVLLMFPLMFFGAFQVVLLYLYGRGVIAVDMFLNLVTTNSREVGELLGNLEFAVATVVVVYMPAIVAGIVACRHKWRLGGKYIRRLRVPALCTAGVGIIAMVAAFLGGSGYRIENDLFPINVIYNACLAVDRTVKTKHISNTDYKHYAFFENDSTVREVYIMVVGETARGDRWELNGYERHTNPGMDSADWISFPHAFSESNTTHKSVPMLLSHIDAETFSDSIYHVKGIMAAFAEAGGRTAFFSNQRYNHSFIDRFGFEADTAVFIREECNNNKTFTDLDMLPLVERELKVQARRELIVLHTYGSHFNYADRYNGISGAFKPDYPLQARKKYKTELNNAYDNTICLTSRLLSSLAMMIERDSIVGAVIYTSDHGEDIFDDQRGLFLHASPMPTIYQVHVPFAVWMSRKYRMTYPQRLANARGNKMRKVSSSRSFFQTLCSLASLRCAVRDSSASVVDGCYVEKPSRYLNDHNECVALDAVL